MTNIQQATGNIKGFTVEFHVLPAGVKFTKYCAENGISTNDENVFIDVIGSDDYTDWEDWKFYNEAPFKILNEAQVDLSNARTIIHVQK